jgi:hypothetical protein
VGNNGSVSDRQFDEIMGELKLVARVIFVNIRVPRTWEETNNTCLADGISRTTTRRWWIGMALLSRRRTCSGMTALTCALMEPICTRPSSRQQ